MDDLAFRERRCPVCKKIFITSNEWVFKKTYGSHEKQFCSWGCLRKYEKSHGTPAQRREAIQQAIMDGLTTNEISVLLDEDKTKIDYWRKKMAQCEDQ